MAFQRIAGLCSVWIVIASAAAAGQSPQSVVSTLLMPGTEGKQEPFQQVVTKTTSTASGAVRTTRDVFGFSYEGRPRLAETIESAQQTAADGRTIVIRDAWMPDPDGRLRVSYRAIEETRLVPPDIRETVVTVLMPDPDQRLQEMQRLEFTARQESAGVARHDTTQLFRDVNGRWQFVERRSLVVRDVGPSERIEEETIQRPDVYGTLVVSERHVTRRSEAAGREEVVAETYVPGAVAGYDARLGLSVRVRTSTTAAADGGRNTIEEVETINPAALSEPLRVTRRTVIAVRRAGPDRWATERQVFERDVNGRMVPLQTETEETTGGQP